jgi:hypothetical protein
MPSRKLWDEGEETSWEKWETGPAHPSDLTEQRNTPRLAKGVSAKGSDSQMSVRVESKRLY